MNIVYELDFQNFSLLLISEKPFESETNFTDEFFQGQDYKPITQLFDYPGYKTEPIRVQFMLQE